MRNGLSPGRKLIYKIMVLEILESKLENYTKSIIYLIIKKFERILNIKDIRDHFTKKK